MMTGRFPAGTPYSAVDPALVLWVHATLLDTAVTFEDAFEPLIGRFTRFNLPNLKVHRTIDYDVHCNWKLLFQNYSECLHCPMIHPELALVLPYQSGANDLTSGPFLGGYMEIRAPHDRG